MPTGAQIKRIVSILGDVAKLYGINDAFFIGGYPRTVAMGLPLSDVHDLDIATSTPGKASQLGGLLAEQTQGEIEERTKSTFVKAHGVELDFQAASEHEFTSPYLHAFDIDATPLAKNIFDRDFTVNSLAIPLGRNEIIDITRRGMEDLQRRMIASILPAKDVLPKNPLMITRALRLHCKYGFGIEKQTWQAMLENVDSFRNKISPERQAIEAYLLSKYGESIHLLEQVGLPELSLEEMITTGEKEADE
jgi:poly(A) polymerase